MHRIVITTGQGRVAVSSLARHPMTGQITDLGFSPPHEAMWLYPSEVDAIVEHLASWPAHTVTLL